MAALGALTFRFTLKGKAVPRQWVQPIQRYLREYQTAFHVSPGHDNPNVILAEKLELIDFLLAVLLLWGQQMSVCSRSESWKRVASTVCGSTYFSETTISSCEPSAKNSSRAFIDKLENLPRDDDWSKGS